MSLPRRRGMQLVNTALRDVCKKGYKSPCLWSPSTVADNKSCQSVIGSPLYQLRETSAFWPRKISLCWIQMMDFEKQLVHGSPWQDLLRRPRSPERFHKIANIMANKINQMPTIWKIPCAYHLVTCWILDDAPIKNQMMCWYFTKLFGFRAKQKELQALQADLASFTEPETVQAIVVDSEKCCDNHAHHLGFATWHAWFLRNMIFPIYKCNSALDT